MPAEIVELYEKEPDWRVSDDFDGPIDFEKWCYRKPLDDGKKHVDAGPEFVSTEDGVLSVRAKAETMSGSGLSAKNVAHFGFYVTKWRYLGVRGDNRTAFHPSIWAANGNSGVEGRRALTGKDWIEIDFVEYENTKPASWSGDAPVRIDGKIHNGREGTEKAIFLPQKTRTDFVNWKIVGLEYNPDYLQMWEYEDGEWRKIGRRVGIVESEAATWTSFPKKCAKPVYWILSNIQMDYQKGNVTSDTTLEVDYFYYYPVR